ncbi:Co2+/Mg2+ efflux protein ApaG [Thioalkalivibrio sp. XN279]|uniref:Co2+/Mg2+ efflux protein ApaG n=1 Tax=Thioalkalivibrio sp. XN279 TaxID=2714953 RepID=UPI001408BAC2|nr:Co2+/Mg2+ efflux protein ApaG [Thioalkalivibrio sp. XN279]NHA15049.1 Co2+/Mg2+ efflux protein ApaG [Thioalkalivibrio sp. XN279]
MADCPIRIEVETAYLDHQSEPDEGRYAFAYSITIHNDGPVAAKLLSRHWIITDADGGVQEVRGEGVVGEQPLIRPGEHFHYSSGAILPTPVGSMRGAYTMIDASGHEFQAPIAAFTLARPGTLH